MEELAILSKERHAERRRVLQSRVGEPVLLMGNGLQCRNLPMNKFPFRQDSNLLYYSGCSIPGAAMLVEEGASTLYLPFPGPGDALWHGAHPSAEELSEQYGVAVKPIEELEGDLEGCNPLGLAVSDPAANAVAAKLTGRPLSFGGDNGPEKLVDAVIEARRVKDELEAEQHRKAAVVTREAHIAAMRATGVDVHEREVAAAFTNVLRRAGATEAYSSIVTVRGEVLHNPHYTNTLQAGELLLLDGGAEVASGYCCDVTRTWPVTGRFSDMQRSAYEAVLEAHQSSVALCTPGRRYRDIHLHSVRVIAQWLIGEGFLRCGVDEAVESGAAALFFPHGVGHLLGLDVHDLEAFGDRPAYAPGRSRSTQFGLGALRLDLDLEPGHLVTIEPGFYMVDPILDSEELTAPHSSRLNREVIEKWRGFGGIRLEDDILVRDGAPENLTQAIPITVAEVEATMAARGDA